MIEHCKICGHDWDVPDTDDEPCQYFCPKCSKLNVNPLMLDEAIKKCLTIINQKLEHGKTKKKLISKFNPEDDHDGT
jgi:hypothetical protein